MIPTGGITGWLEKDIHFTPLISLYRSSLTRTLNFFTPVHTYVLSLASCLLCHIAFAFAVLFHPSINRLIVGLFCSCFVLSLSCFPSSKLSSYYPNLKISCFTFAYGTVPYPPLRLSSRAQAAILRVGLTPIETTHTLTGQTTSTIDESMPGRIQTPLFDSEVSTRFSTALQHRQTINSGALQLYALLSALPHRY